MSAKALRSWYGVHKWTSLVCTLFLLLLCLTGLPLIFKAEIDVWTGAIATADGAASSQPDYRAASPSRRRCTEQSSTGYSAAQQSASTPLAHW
ncbi:MAG: PepSY domain-containing protein [Proteobacteria bacterium]|nr:PepSY domain-containing protein [Pseudomonadota bacterium]